MSVCLILSRMLKLAHEIGNWPHLACGIDCAKVEIDFCATATFTLSSFTLLSLSFLVKKLHCRWLNKDELGEYIRTKHLVKMAW